MHFLPHRSISLARSKYCTPQLPQRTIFHTGLLHVLRSHVHRSLQSAEKLPYGIVTIRHWPHRPKRHTGLITTRVLSPHRFYHHTGLITTQVLSPHRSYHHTGLITTQDLSPHRTYHHTGLITTQVLSPHRSYHHTGFITTQDYFLTGLFCHRFILHMRPLYAFLPHRSISLARSKYCTPHLPQRTIFHTGLLHALRSNRS